MKNQEYWKPTKFVYRRGKLRASKDLKEVGIGSRLAADLTAEFYDEKIKKYAKGHLLDLGCGKAPLYNSYKKHVEKVTCIDWGNTDHNNDYLDMEMDLNKSLDLSSDQYDTIIISSVLEHIAEPQLLMEEMRRILKKDGHVLLNVPFYYSIHAEPYDYYRYTEFALKHMSEKAGFRVVELKAFAGAPEVLTDIIAKIVCKIPVIGKPIAKFYQWSTWVFIHTRFGHNFSQKTAKKFPLGYNLICTK